MMSLNNINNLSELMEVNNQFYKQNSTLCNAGINTLGQLRSSEEVPLPYRKIFEKYPYFNVIQSTVFPHIFQSDDNFVISSPTGSGKTLVFELAIVNLLLKYNIGEKFPYLMVYVAPVKALCDERLQDWHLKFAQFGISCLAVTGDSDEFDCQIKNLMMSNLIITTPEKWDTVSRRWKENQQLMKMVKLFMIDEVHILNDDTRGPTLEAIVSRMKMIQQFSEEPNSIRFIALSATIVNLEDIAEWIGTAKNPAKYFRFGEDMRPVQLKKIVLGYPYNPQMSSPFKFDIMLSYKLQNIIMQYSDGKPTLIFCSTRKSTEMTAKQVMLQLTINLTLEKKKLLEEACYRLQEKTVKDTLIHGVGMHHAGIILEDRKILEDLFRSGHLPVLVATSTLAMGINLPAHLVIVKSTKYYAKGEYKDHSESTILQMIGRAGRPQYDSTATAVIMTTSSDKHKYENMVGGLQPVESNLHKNLIEHLNAEVVLHTITDLSLAMEWLASTFLYVRARKNPKHYGLPLGLNATQLDNKLLELCQIEINKLAKEGMLMLDENVSIKPIRKGFLMVKYYVQFKTMKLFNEITGQEIIQKILSLISRCHEFSEMYLRVSDKKCLNLLNYCRGKDTIRYQLNGKIKTLDMKINCLIQAVLGSLQILEPSLATEAQKIVKIGERITGCLTEYLKDNPKCFSALLSTIILNKCFRAQLWENSTYIAKQLPKIGAVYSKHLSDAGKKTFQDILKANPRDLERILNKKPPFGNDIQEQVKYLPQYEIKLELEVENEVKTVCLYFTVLNVNDLMTKMTVDENSCMILIVGDSDNNILVYNRYKHSYLRENCEMLLTMELNNPKLEQIRAYLISEDWVGIDSYDVLTLNSNINNRNNNIDEYFKTVNKKSPAMTDKPKAVKNKSKEPTQIQKFMDMYCNKVKKSNIATKTKKERVKDKGIQRTITGLIKKNKKISVDNEEKGIIDAENFFSNLTENTKEMCKSNKSSETMILPKITENGISNKNIYEEFESKLMSSPLKPTLSEYKYVEPAKLTSVIEKTQTNNSNMSNTNSTLTIPEKPSLVETRRMSPQKTIKWKSPLVSFANNITQISETPKENTEASAKKDNNLPIIKSINDKPSTSTFKRLNSDLFKKNFPLSDEQCDSDSSVKAKDKENKIEDIISLEFLEEMGIQNFNNTKSQSSTTNSVFNVEQSSNKINENIKYPADYLTLVEAPIPSMQAEEKNCFEPDGFLQHCNNKLDKSELNNNANNTRKENDRIDKSNKEHLDNYKFDFGNDKNENPEKLVNCESEQVNEDSSNNKKRKIEHDNINVELDLLSGKRNISIKSPSEESVSKNQNRFDFQSFSKKTFPTTKSTLEDLFTQSETSFAAAKDICLSPPTTNFRYSLKPASFVTNSFSNQNEELRDNNFSSYKISSGCTSEKVIDYYKSSSNENRLMENSFNCNTNILSQSIFEDDSEDLNLTFNELNSSLMSYKPNQYVNNSCNYPARERVDFMESIPSFGNPRFVNDSTNYTMANNEPFSCNNFRFNSFSNPCLNNIDNDNVTSCRCCGGSGKLRKNFCKFTSNPYNRNFNQEYVNLSHPTTQYEPNNCNYQVSSQYNNFNNNPRYAKLRGSFKQPNQFNTFNSNMNPNMSQMCFQRDVFHPPMNHAEVFINNQKIDNTNQGFKKGFPHNSKNQFLPNFQ